MKSSLLTRIMLAILGIGVVIVVASQFRDYWQSPDADAATEDADGASAQTDAASEDAEASDAELGRVVLSDAKSAAAGIELYEVRRNDMTHYHQVPGRILYNDNRHVAVQTPTSGIVTELLVKPGDRVESGQILALFNSPEIGAARADVLKRQAELDYAKRLQQQIQERSENVQAAVEMVRQQMPFEELQERFRGKPLGDDREQLFGAYSRLLLAESMQGSVADLGGAGALSGKTLRERERELRAAEAALAATCEQAVFDTFKEGSEAEVAALDAGRRLEIARQHLASLLVTRAAIDPTQQTDTASDMGATEDDLAGLSRVAIRAPFAGTIEERQFSVSERVQPTDVLFVLADTSSLWIQADLRENDWAATQLQPGAELKFVSPAIPERQFSAQVYFVGRSVTPETNSVPIIAEIDNSEGLFRPGLFVRISVPVGVSQDAVCVPAESVLRHDEQDFVFVAAGPNTFRRVDVVADTAAGEQVEIFKGLEAGQQVVTHGAFILKSELLLESEEE